MLKDHTVPPTGVRVDSAYRRARWYNGETVLWYSRSLAPGRSAGGSGLAYDQLLPREVDTDTGRFGVVDADMDTSESPALVERVMLYPIIAGNSGQVIQSDPERVINTVRVEKNRGQLKAMIQAQNEIVRTYPASVANEWTIGPVLELVLINDRAYIKPSGGTSNQTEGDDLAPSTSTPS